MALVLKQSRRCDGKCCEEAPRFPKHNSKRKCIYLDGLGDLATACSLQRSERSVPAGPCPVLKKLSSQEAFELTCLNWPQNTKPGTDLGGCCWEWVDG